MNSSYNTPINRKLIIIYNYIKLLVSILLIRMQLKTNLTNNSTNPYDTSHEAQTKNNWE